MKWLKQVEVRETRFMDKFMGRGYVTIREERRGGENVFVETSVGSAQLKSAPARLTRKGSDYWIDGAAWGGGARRHEPRRRHAGPRATQEADPIIANKETYWETLARSPARCA